MRVQMGQRVAKAFSKFSEVRHRGNRCLCGEGRGVGLCVRKERGRERDTKKDAKTRV